MTRPNGTSSTIFLVGNTGTVSNQSLMEIGTGSQRQYWWDNKYAGNTTYSIGINKVTVWGVSDPGGTTNAVILQDGQPLATQVKTQNTNWTSGGAYYLGDDRTGGNRLTGTIAEVI